MEFKDEYHSTTRPPFIDTKGQDPIEKFRMLDDLHKKKYKLARNYSILAVITLIVYFSLRVNYNGIVLNATFLFSCVSQALQYQWLKHKINKQIDLWNNF